MDAIVGRWIACPRCGGDLAAADGGLTCQSCGTRYGEQDGVLDLVDPTQKVSSEGPGDTLGMAWRRRRWDELRGPEAPENAAYLAAIWERLRPDDRVVDLGCGPGSFPAWMAEFAPELAIVGIDLSWGALEEAGRTVGPRPNVRLVRASTRRRLPLRDASTDVVLRRLAPGLPEEIIRVLAPGGYYLRFTFGPNHWREVYDLMPGLPRAREDTLVGEAERLRQLGLEVEEPIHETGTEEFSLPAVLLALRSNPAAFHAERLDLQPLRQRWRDGEGRRATRISLSTDYAILVARRPAAGVIVPAPVAAEAAANGPTEAPAADVHGPAEAAAAAPGSTEAPAVAPGPAEAPATAANGPAEPASRRRTRSPVAKPARSGAKSPAPKPTGEAEAAAPPTPTMPAAPANQPPAGSAETTAEPPRRRSRKATAEAPSAPPARRARKVAAETPLPAPRRRARKSDPESGADPSERATDSAAEEKPKRSRSRKPAPTDDAPG